MLPIPLTRREQEVAELLLQGKSNKQIAALLGISESTVEFHIKNIYAKLGVSSRPEAILKLGKSTGVFGGDLGETTVAAGAENGHNGGVGSPEPAGLHEPEPSRNTWKASLVFWKVGVFLLAAIALLVVATFALRKPAAWDGYERECEFPDEVTVGRMVERANASAARAHGEFGTAGAPLWSAVPGSVRYTNIRTPHLQQLVLLLRYSKDSPATEPLEIFLDGEALPRARIYLLDLGDWGKFAWTVPIDLGEVSRGTHSITFSTQGQPDGVAELDQMILTDPLP
jgi:DNA-binding CsgD family transcriptional regulator